MKTCTACAILMLCTFPTAAPAEAQSIAMSDLGSRLRSAQKAVVGRVIGVRARFARNQWGDELILSRLSIAVEEPLKGHTGAGVLDVDVEGGTVGGLTLHVSHQPRLRAGDRTVLFLDAGPQGTYVPHRKGQGVLRLDRDNRVEGTRVTLADVRAAARAAVR